MNEAQSKKVRKSNFIKFNIVLNEEQKKGKELILENTISVLRGGAGSGKTILAAQIALDLLFKEEVDRIILTRPAVTSGEDIGFLPGDKDEKLAPYTAAIYDNMNRLCSKEKIDKCIQDGEIEIIPLGFMRGRNLSKCIVVVDEGQNITSSQMELLLGRLCTGSKMIICGDTSQIDLKNRKESGFEFICNNLKDIPGFTVVTLLQNHRDPIVEKILKVYDGHRS